MQQHLGGSPLSKLREYTTLCDTYNSARLCRMTSLKATTAVADPRLHVGRMLPLPLLFPFLSSPSLFLSLSPSITLLPFIVLPSPFPSLSSPSHPFLLLLSLPFLFKLYYTIPYHTLPLPSPLLKFDGERLSSPSGVRGRAPAANVFLRYFEARNRN